MDYTNKQYTLDDGNTYIVIEQVEFNNHSYLYIAIPVMKKILDS